MRKYILKIGDERFSTPDPNETDPKKTYALDIKFDVEFPRIGGACRRGTMSILGLTEEQRDRFLELSAIDAGAARAKRLAVDLFAGYDDGPLVRVFSGFAVSATVTAPPDMWLNLVVEEFNSDGGKVVKFTKLAKKGVKYKIGDIASELLGNFTDSKGNKISFVDLTKKGKNVGNETVASFGDGTGFTLQTAVIAIDDLSHHWTACLRENTVYAYPNGSLNDGNGTKDDIIEINAPLSVSGINVKNATITVFLSDGCPFHGRLKLKSQLNKQANGTYQIIKKRFYGHYMGNEWYTQYTCSDRKKDEKKKDKKSS